MVSRTRFVADTHDLWWYFRSPERLSVAASTVFQLAETGNATVAEFHYLSVKRGSPREPSELPEALDSVSGIELSESAGAQPERLDRFPLDRVPEVPEMHDRFIAAEADALGAPPVTRDEALAASDRVSTVW